MKMTISVSRLAAALVITSGLIFAACQKNQEQSIQTDQQAITRSTMEAEAEQDIIADDIFSNALGVNSSVGIGGTGVFEAGSGSGSGTFKTEAPCFSVKFEFLSTTDSFPVRVTLDFGTGCTGRDGRVRKGKIITVYSAPLIRPGSVAETSFDNYFVNDVKVEGTHRIENKSSSIQLMFETKVTDGKLTRSNGDYILWNRIRTITQVDGWGTPWVPADDVYEIVGNGSGTIHRGTKDISWSSTNIEPLVKRFNCHWIVKGKKAVQRNDGPEGILDFGNGDCDNKATLTVNGVVIEITLK